MAWHAVVGSLVLGERARSAMSTSWRNPNASLVPWCAGVLGDFGRQMLVVDVRRALGPSVWRWNRVAPWETKSPTLAMTAITQPAFADLADRSTVARWALRYASQQPGPSMGLRSGGDPSPPWRSNFHPEVAEW